MKKIVKLAGIAAALALSTAALAEAASDEDVVIRVGYFSTPQYQVQLAIAKEKGFFEEAFEGSNVSVEYYSFSGGTALNEAFAAGELDVAHGVGDQPTVSGIANGNEGIILSRIVANAKGNGIFVDYDSDINEVADVKGKTIAVNIGSAGQKGLDLILEDNGLSEDDVELVNLKNIDEIFAAFESNEIDAAVSAQMALSEERAVEGQIARKLVDFTTHPNYAYLTVKSEFIENNPEITEKFVDALYKANLWYHENVEEGDQIVADFLEADVNDVITANASSEISMVLDEDDFTNIQETYDFLERNDLLSETIPDLSAISSDEIINQVIENNK